MALITGRALIADTNAGTRTAAFTPAAGDACILATISSGSTAVVAPTDDHADGLGTYTRILTVTNNGGADALMFWARNKPFAAATAVTISWAISGNTGGGLWVWTQAGVPRGGIYLVRQCAGVSDQAAGTPAVTMPAAILNTNGVISALINTTNPSGVTRWPESDTSWDRGYASPTTGALGAVRSTTVTNTTLTWGSASATGFAAAVLETDVRALAAPAAPTDLTLGTATQTTQPLTWTPPTDTGGQDLTDYVVQYAIAGSGSWNTFADGTSTTASATVTGLTPGTSYDYRVAAVNATGTGSNSTTATGSTASDISAPQLSVQSPSRRRNPYRSI